MRLGCGGCLSALMLIAVVVGATAGFVWLIAGILAPAAVLPTPTTAEDGVRAQQKIYDITRGGRPTRRGPIVLTEAEINAFLSRHLAETADLPLVGLGVRLPAEGVVEVTGRLPLGTILNELLGPGLTRFFPSRWMERPLSIKIRGQARLDPGTTGRRYLRVDVDGFWLGRRRLPAMLVRLLFSPVAVRLLRWPLPETIENLSVHREHLVIQVSSSSPAHSEPAGRR